MKKLALAAAALASLMGCTTPTTTLKHPQTKQVTTCGGSSGASWAGGAIGYHIQKDNDEHCVKTHQGQGFEVMGVTE